MSNNMVPPKVFKREAIEINDIYTIKKDSIIKIDAFIISIEKKVLASEIAFYILKLLDRTGIIESCICPKYYEKEIAIFNLKATRNIAYKIKLQCIITKKHPIPLLFIIDINRCGFPAYLYDLDI